jgi:putative ABC transport system substrate-binding protein
MFGMRRREVITLLGGAAAVWTLAVPAHTKQMRRIGVVMGLVASDPEAQARVVAFENGLRELGWIKGRNLSPGTEMYCVTTRRSCSLWHPT